MRTFALSFYLLCFALIVSAFIATPTLTAQNLDDKLSLTQRDKIASIESQILSPFCTGRLLKDCPSSAANDLRRDIKEKVFAGIPEEEILSDLYEKYGSDLKAVPEIEGFGSVAWLAPLVFLFVGFLIILRLIKRPNEADES